MPRTALLFVALLTAATIFPHSSALSAAGDVDAAFRAFWNAPTAAAAEKTVQGILESGADFDTSWARLRAGRTYAREKTGLIKMPTSVGGVTVGNLIEIPETYDPAKRWELRVQLHGGVGRDLPEPNAAPQPQSTRIPG